MISLNNKIAIITGASRGLGKAVAIEMAKNGASIVVNYAGHTEAAHHVVYLIEKAGGKAITVQADVSIAADVTRLYDTTIAAFGRVDIVVNNAGVMLTNPLHEA